MSLWGSLGQQLPALDCRALLVARLPWTAPAPCSYASDAQEQHLGQRCGGADIEDGAAAFCVPADGGCAAAAGHVGSWHVLPPALLHDAHLLAVLRNAGVHCKGCKWDPERGVCFRNDCDALFTPADLRRRQLTQWAPDPHPQLIITAGPERSGSTWLFNAGGWVQHSGGEGSGMRPGGGMQGGQRDEVGSCTRCPPPVVVSQQPTCRPRACRAVRLLFQHARKPLDAYWLKDVTDAALDARGVGGWGWVRRPGGWTGGPVQGHGLLLRAWCTRGWGVRNPETATPGCPSGKPGAHHVLIKTHAWSEEFDLGRATHGGLARESATLFSADVWAPASADGSPACPRLAPVFVTHRDLRQVLASFRRMTW